MRKEKIVKISLMITIFVAVLVLSYLYYQQQGESARLQEALDSAEERYNSLKEEADRLNDELQELRLNYEELLEQSKEGDNTQPVDGNPPEQAPDGSSPGGSGPTVYLTIDDGPSRNTLEILEILKEYQVPATFFVTGNNVSGDNAIYRRIVNEGHAIGNHTYTHNFEGIYASPEAFMEDFVRLENFIYKETGVRTDIMRFPGGSSSSMAQEVSGYNIIVEELIESVVGKGYDYFDWNITSGDHDSKVSAETIIANVKEQLVRRGGDDIVLLFHDGRNNQPTVEALPAIIDYLQSRGYEFAPLHKGAIVLKHR